MKNKVLLVFVVVSLFFVAGCKEKFDLKAALQITQQEVEIAENQSVSFDYSNGDSNLCFLVKNIDSSHKIIIKSISIDNTDFLIKGSNGELLPLPLKLAATESVEISIILVSSLDVKSVGLVTLLFSNEDDSSSSKWIFNVEASPSSSVGGLGDSGLDVKGAFNGVVQFEPTVVGEASSIALKVYNCFNLSGQVVVSRIVSDSPNFSWDGLSVASVIESDDSVIMRIYFSPTESILYDSKISIYTLTGSFSFRLKGEGLFNPKPVGRVFLDGEVVENLSTTVFPSRSVGDSSLPRLFSLKNIGSGNLTVTSISVDDSVNYTISGFSGEESVGPSDSLDFSLVFNPATGSEVGECNTVMDIVYSTGGFCRLFINSSIIGDDVPQFLLSRGDLFIKSGDSLGLSSVAKGGLSSTSLKISNLGSPLSSLLISDITIENNSFSYIIDGDFPLTIIGGNFLDLTIEITPSIAGVISTSLSLNTNDPEDSLFEINLTSLAFDSLPILPPVVSGESVNLTGGMPRWDFATADGSCGINNYRVKINSDDFSEGVTTIPDESFFTPNEPLMDGMYTLYVSQESDFGTWSALSSYSIEVDLTKTAPPVNLHISNPVEHEGINYSNDKKVGFSWSPSDASDCSGYRFSIDDELSWTEVSKSITNAMPLFDLLDGAHTVYVQTKDRFERWSDSADVTINIDTVGPDIVLNPTKGTVEELLLPQGQSVSLFDAGASAVDAVFGDCSGSISVDYSNVINITEGTYSIEYSAQDSLGNSSTVKSRVVYVVNLASPDVLLDRYFPSGGEPFSLVINNIPEVVESQLDYSWDITGGTYSQSLNGVDSTGHRTLGLTLSFNPVDHAVETKSVAISMTAHKADSSTVIIEGSDSFGLYPQLGLRDGSFEAGYSSSPWDILWDVWCNYKGAYWSYTDTWCGMRNDNFSSDRVFYQTDSAYPENIYRALDGSSTAHTGSKCFQKYDLNIASGSCDLTCTEMYLWQAISVLPHQKYRLSCYIKRGASSNAIYLSASSSEYTWDDNYGYIDTAHNYHGTAGSDTNNSWVLLSVEFNPGENDYCDLGVFKVGTSGDNPPCGEWFVDSFKMEYIE